MSADDSANPPLLDADLYVRRGGSFRLDISVDAHRGEVVALLGPNGAGKTTALRALAGLTPLSGGRIRLNATVLDDPDRGTWVAPEHRRVGVVFQDYLLFPHLSAVDNVAFGPRCRGMGRRDARRIGAGWLDRVGLGELADRKPGQLSGGQAQRVALARALAVEPDLLLLDEPLAALDAQTKMDTRVALRHHLAAHAGATLLVTHDPLDALMLADRLVIVEHGQVVQVGDAASVTAQPRSDYVARLVGLNVYRGHGDGHVVTISGGGSDGDGVPISVVDTVHGPAFVAFAPAAVAIHLSRPDGSPRNCWPATVTSLQRHGDNLRVELTGPILAWADITPAAAAHLRLARGQLVWAAVKASETRAYSD